MLPPRYIHTLKVEVSSHVPFTADTLELAVWKAIDKVPLRDCKVRDVRRTYVEKV